MAKTQTISACAPSSDPELCLGLAFGETRRPPSPRRGKGERHRRTPRATALPRPERDDEEPGGSIPPFSASRM
nr:hypothetical protein SHINE37_41932 [Rhizobiaceae bacterium]